MVRHLGLTRYRRSFEKFGGEIYTADSPLDSSVTATVDVTSFDTGLEKFNEHLFGEQFLDTANHPTATFRSTGVRQHAGHFFVDGSLSLRGFTQTTTLDVEILGFGEGLKGERKAAFSAKTTINRRDFGITFDSRLPGGTLVVGDEVTINLEIEAVLR
jgi:polyisoprenoid-binding protein YceI